MTDVLQPVDLSVLVVPVEWLTRPYLARDKVTILAGQAGSGKSLLSVQWALGLLGQGKHVAIVDAENGPDMMRSRYQSLCTALKIPSSALDNLLPVEADGFDMLSDMDKLGSIMQASDLLILDSWVSLWSGSENNVRQVHEVLGKLQAMSREANCATLLIHHALKSGQSYRGSGAVGGAVDAVYVLSRGRGTKAQNQRILACDKMRFAPEPSPATLTLEPSGVFTGLPSMSPGEPTVTRMRPRLLSDYVRVGNVWRHVRPSM